MYAACVGRLYSTVWMRSPVNLLLVFVWWLYAPPTISYYSLLTVKCVWRMRVCVCLSVRMVRMQTQANEERKKIRSRWSDATRCHATIPFNGKYAICVRCGLRYKRNVNVQRDNIKYWFYILWISWRFLRVGNCNFSRKPRAGPLNLMNCCWINHRIRPQPEWSGKLKMWSIGDR